MNKPGANQSTAPMVEKRYCRESVSVRATTVSNSIGTLVGYAAVFNSPTDLGFFYEVVMPGAFDQSISQGQDVRALYNHDAAHVIGRRSAKTLRLSTDATGLKVEIDLPDTSTARDLMANIQSGNIDGMSFGFRVKQENWIADQKEKEGDLRQLVEVELIEVSAVTFPAYPDTTIAKRNLDIYEAAKQKFFAGPPATPLATRATSTPSAQLLRYRIARH